MSEGIEALLAWQTSATERLRNSPEGSRWLLASPTGTGKGRVVAAAAQAWRSKEPSRTLIVARHVIAENLAEQIDPHTPLRWLSKSLMREEGWDLALDPADVVFAATSGEILADPWVVDVLSDVGWNQIIVDLDGTPADAIESIVLLTGRIPLARLVMLASTPAAIAAETLGATVMQYISTGGLISAYPGFAEHFRSATFERTDAEFGLIAEIDQAVADVGLLAGPLGLEAVQTAASSSFYAMQTTALGALNRLRERRNLLVHEALGAEEFAAEGGPVPATALVRVFAQLEKWAAAVDRMTFDSRHQAFLELVLPPASVNRTGSTLIFCGLAATADYVDHGLRLMRQSSATLTDLRERGIKPDAWLRTPGAVLVGFDEQLQGLDFAGARQAINYDVPTTPARLAIRATRLRWTDPSSEWAVWTLLPASEQLSALEAAALTEAPFLAGPPHPHPDSTR